MHQHVPRQNTYSDQNSVANGGNKGKSMPAVPVLQKSEELSEEELPAQNEFDTKRKAGEPSPLPVGSPLQQKPEAITQNFVQLQTRTQPEGPDTRLSLQTPFIPVQKKDNDNGLPHQLKTGVQNLSGFAMDDVKVHYNSDKPAQLQAHAYAQGTDIHIGPGQEKHLPHEAWHVAQQKQGRVNATMQMKGDIAINDDALLENEADVMGAKALDSGNNEDSSIQPDLTNHTTKQGTVQKQVIQRNYDPDAKILEAATKVASAQTKITANDYSGAFADYLIVKGIARELHAKHADGIRNVFRRHTEAITNHVKTVIEKFNEKVQPELSALTENLSNLNIKYEPIYNLLYEKIALKLKANEPIVELRLELLRNSTEHAAEIKKISDKAKSIPKFNALVKDDAIISYTNEKNTYAGTVADTKISPLDVTVFKGFATKTTQIHLKSTQWHEKTGEVTEEPTGKNSMILLLLSGSEERKTAITGIVGLTHDQQVNVFTTINKHHRGDDIADTAALINAIGLTNLAQTLDIINHIAAKGTIANITNFYNQSKNIKGTPALTNIIAFLKQNEYASVTELTTYVTAVAAQLSLEDIQTLWRLAKPKNAVDNVTALFAPDIIPPGLATKAIEIATLFVGQKGSSTAKDWAKLLAIPDWSSENIIALVTAFADKDGNVPAERWAEAAKADGTLKTKPNEVRAAAKLGHFANDDWYTKQDTKKLSSATKAKKKYTQLLYAMMAGTDLTGLGDVSFENIKGDFLSMLVFFHKHIASFNAGGGQGFDREATGGGTYARSSKDHPLNQQYSQLLEDRGIDVSKLLQPLNSALLNLQGKGRASKDTRPLATGSISATPYRTGGISVASAGLPSHNLKVIRDQQEIISGIRDPKAAKKDLFGAPILGEKPKESRAVGDDPSITDSLLAKQKTLLTDKVKPDENLENFHDGLLKDRGTMVSDLSSAINSITGPGILEAIGSEGHPSLILKIPKPASKFRYNSTDYGSTKLIVPTMVTDFNSAPGQEIKATERGSFGFQRPTIADTGESVRFWPGYTPVELIKPGLKALVAKIRGTVATNLRGTTDFTDLKTDGSEPLIYVQALKTAMRHAFIAMTKKIAIDAAPEKKRVYEWLRTRLLIKLQQAGILITKAATLYNDPSGNTTTERNKHFMITADMTDKLQEYSMLYTAAVTKDTENPNKNHNKAGKFKNTDDVYEKQMVAKLAATDYRMFYMDSGEQALITAGILANRFQQVKDETDADVPSSKYISKNPYFEVSTFGGDRRSNLENDATGTIVHADLSPVITSGIHTPKPKAETDREIKRTWQDERGEVNKSAVIPIFDITNSSIDEVVGLGKMPNNFIIVESLTKHQQLGADKFIMGRLIAVSKTKGTEGENALVKTKFLDLAQKIVGPVANEAYNPLLSEIRANMDKALYSDEIA